MKTIVSANQKGGVGKTSTIVHLAFDFAERGKKVVFIDADPQQNATWTLIQYHCGIASSELFNEETPHFTALPAAGISLIAANDLLADIEKKNLSEAAQNFARSIEALGEFYDVCLIDTPPTLGVGLTSALVSADFVFSPIMLESYSLQGIGKLLTTISNVKQFNPSMIFLGMLPNLVDMRNPRHKANLAELEVAYPDLLMPAQIGLRSSIAEAVATKLPVWKIKKTAARVASKEVKKFTQFVFDKAEIG